MSSVHKQPVPPTPGATFSTPCAIGSFGADGSGALCVWYLTGGTEHHYTVAFTGSEVIADRLVASYVDRDGFAWHIVEAT